jgi:hypothetical protein
MPIGLSGQNLFNSNRELIEHHIKQRKEKETLFTKSRTSLKGERFEIQIQSKFGMVGFGVDVSQRAKVLNKDGETVDGYLYNEALSEHFDTIEEAIEYANEVFQGDKEFIEETNAKYDAELAALEETETNNTEDGEIIPSETEEITEVFVADSDRVTVAMIKDQLDKANTAQEVQTVVDNLNISVASEFVFNEDITEMVELIKAKKESLVVPQDMPIISESLEKGTELVAKKNIFTGAKNIVYATQDSILMVTNVDTVNKTVSVKALNSNKTIKIKFSDMNENFGLKTNLMNGTEKPDEPLTSEDKTFVSESIDLTTTFIEDKTKIDAIEKAASAKTIQELEDDLLEDIFC